ncbi:MAG: alpha/beta hydrolase [Proteobacteria bacterium]|nr:alpha/beta hydrolase [Pseudomonadota bacterium]
MDVHDFPFHDALLLVRRCRIIAASACAATAQPVCSRSLCSSDGGIAAWTRLPTVIAIAARDNGWQERLHQVLVYPIANNDMNSESYIENANAKPLGKEAMQWFVEHYFESPQQTADPRIALAKRDDLAGLAPATIILAQIDPLRSDGRAYAEALRAAGVPVTLEVYDGVTHEFFGMAAVVDKAEQAQQLAGEQLREAFEQE